MTVVTRFAPSPTGFLHIGGARTALFNWLFARHHGGKYLLRIEDTDIKRSTAEAINAIKEGLNWLDLQADDAIVFQSRNAARHREIAKYLLAEGKAYYCYCSPEELAEMRTTAKAEGRPIRYDGRWRDRPAEDAPDGRKPVVRIKMPQKGETVIDDLVQGTVTIQNEQLDDFILLRTDGSPTYMLSVVVDDHDMEITHIIRGDDHLTNAFRQYHLYRALGWKIPAFAHIPLIHGPDGTKLSKRHGALGVESYRDDMGYLPESVCNYLLRLGWSHGDEEIISRDQAIAWFDLAAVGRSAARFDFAKLENLNGQYIRKTDDLRLLELILPHMGGATDETGKARLKNGMPGLKERAKTIHELAENAKFYLHPPSYPLAVPKAAKMLTEGSAGLLSDLARELEALSAWDEESLAQKLKDFADAKKIGFGKIAQPLRAALTGTNMSPGLTEVMKVLGQEECLSRMRAVPKQADFNAHTKSTGASPAR